MTLDPSHLHSIGAAGATDHANSLAQLAASRSRRLLLLEEENVVARAREGSSACTAGRPGTDEDYVPGPLSLTCRVKLHHDSI